MYSQYNWLFDVSSIGQFFKRLGILILSIILFLIYIMAVSSGISRIILNNPKNNGHILINMPILSSIICIVTPGIIIALIIVYFVFRKDFTIGGRTRVISSTTYYMEDNKMKIDKRYSLSFAILILISALLFFYFVNSYYVIFDNKIEKRNILSSKEISFLIQDIKEVSIGVKNNRKYGCSLYYKIVLKNDVTINAANNMIAVEDETKGLQKINDIVKKNNIKRNIDKTHFHDLVEGLAEEYAREYEKLFED